MNNENSASVSETNLFLLSRMHLEALTDRARAVKTLISADVISSEATHDDALLVACQHWDKIMSGFVPTFSFSCAGNGPLKAVFVAYAVNLPHCLDAFNTIVFGEANIRRMQRLLNDQTNLFGAILDGSALNTPVFLADNDIARHIIPAHPAHVCDGGCKHD